MFKIFKSFTFLKFMWCLTVCLCLSLCICVCVCISVCVSARVPVGRHGWAHVEINEQQELVLCFHRWVPSAWPQAPSPAEPSHWPEASRERTLVTHYCILCIFSSKLETETINPDSGCAALDPAPYGNKTQGFKLQKQGSDLAKR